MILPVLVSFLITLAATPLVIIFAKKTGLIDDPKIHKHPALIHTKPIPRAGGIALFLGVLGGIFFLPMTKISVALFTASLLALIIGTLDDKYDISRYIRFGMNFLCAGIVVASGIGIPFITNPFGGIIHFDLIKYSFYFFGIHTLYPISDVLAIFWIVWVMNMLNWSKGVDGQMPGVVAISSFFIGLLSLRFPVSDIQTQIAATISFLITGASLGFLVWNFYPAKIFPGYGATAIYLLLSAASILSGAKLATAILVMGVPMTDGLFTLIRRIFSGKSPFLGDKKHLHHLLLKIGFGQRRIALTYWFFSAVLGMIALALSSREKAFAILMLIVVCSGILFFLLKLTDANNEKHIH